MAAAASGEDAELFSAVLGDAPALCYSDVIAKLKGCTVAEATGFLAAAYHELRGAVSLLFSLPPRLG